MTQPSVVRLKELLFDKESRDIDALSRRIDQLAERSGSDEQFRRAVARVLDASLKDAEKVRHQELTNALAPMVRRTFRAEIRSESVQSELSSALYPKIGDMIRRYVASAMRDLMDTINRKLEGGLTKNRLVLKLRSLTSGRSMAELALADTQRFQVDEIYLIRRGSGELVHRWSRPGSGVAAETPGGNRDTLVSGFLTAITAFAEEAFATDRASLRALDLDDHRIYLRASPDYLLAAKCSGSSAASVEEVLDAGLIEVLAEHQGVEARYPPDAGEEARAIAHREHERVLQTSSAHIEEQIAAAAAKIRQSRGSFRSLKIAAFLIGIPLLALLSWQLYTTHLTSNLQRSVDHAIATVHEIVGYPVTARVERGAKLIHVQGLTPSLAARSSLYEALDAVSGGAELRKSVGVLPSIDVTAAIEADAANRDTMRAAQRLTRLAAELADIVASGVLAREHETLKTLQSEITLGARTLQRLDGAQRRDTTRVVEIARGLQRSLDNGLLDLGQNLGGQGPSLAAASSIDARDASANLERVTLTAERLSTVLALLVQQMALVDARARELQSLSERHAKVTSDIATLAERVDALKPIITPQAQLQAFVAGNAIFFSTATDYRDPDLATRQLNELARLILATDDLVRIVGYTDEAGSLSLNQTLSQQRADKIEIDLVARGVPRSRLVTVGRGTNMELQPRSGTTNASRRVQFELAFKGERPMQP